MAVHPELEPGEELQFSNMLKSVKKGGLVPNFSFAVSTRALFIPNPLRHVSTFPPGTPRSRRIFKRVPLDEVQSVEVTQSEVGWLWIVSLLLIAGGIGMLLFQWYVALRISSPGDHGLESSPLGLLPLALAAIVGGLALPWAMRSRLLLIVKFGDEEFVWKSELLLGGEHKLRTRKFLMALADACSRVGVVVVADE